MHRLIGIYVAIALFDADIFFVLGHGLHFEAFARVKPLSPEREILLAPGAGAGAASAFADWCYGYIFSISLLS